MSTNTVIIDDQDSRVKYTGLWSLSGSTEDYSQTTYAPRAEGAQLSFTFSGTSIAVVGRYDAGGTCNATFSLDGQTSFNFTSPLLNTSRHQQILWTSPQLSEGQHTLTYTNADCKSNATNDTVPYVWVDYLLYNTSSVPEAATIFIDDRDPRLFYSGNWIKDGGENDFLGTRQGGKQGTSFQLTFNGSFISVHGRLDNSSSINRVSFGLDGGDPWVYGTPAQNIISYNKEFYKNGSLPNGKHTLVVEPLTDNPFWLDYILVRGSANASNTGQKHSSSTSMIGAIVGSILGTLIIVIFGAIVFLALRRRRKLPPSKLHLLKQANENSDAFDPFSREAMVPPRPLPESDALSSHSSRGLLDSRRNTFKSSTVTESSYQTEEDDERNLPPDYATTAPSGINIGYVPSSNGHQSYYSETSSAHYPPSLPHTLSTVHHRYSSLSRTEMSDDTSSFHHYPPTRSEARSSRSKRSSASGSARRLNSQDTEQLSVTDWKRRQQQQASNNPEPPIVHTDSGIRLQAESTRDNSASPSRSASTHRQVPIDDDNTSDFDLHSITSHSSSPNRRQHSTHTESTRDIAEMKRRLASQGTTEIIPVVHSDSGLRINPPSNQGNLESGPSNFRQPSLPPSPTSAVHSDTRRDSQNSQNTHRSRSNHPSASNRSHKSPSRTRLRTVVNADGDEELPREVSRREKAPYSQTGPSSSTSPRREDGEEALAEVPPAYTYF